MPYFNGQSIACPHGVAREVEDALVDNSGDRPPREVAREALTAARLLAS